MPEGSRGTPGRFGRDHRGARKRSKHPVLKGVVTTLFILVLVALAAGVLYVYGAIKDIETPNPKDIADGLRVSSVMYDSDGKVIKNLYLGEGQRSMATYGQLPENLKNAIIAIEDKTFWEHHGFNFVRIMGAIRDSVFGGGQVSGTSTISQQLARNIWIEPEQRSARDMKRKIQEAYYAVQLENNLTKEEILTDYLNTIPLGYHSLGVNSAAKNYFNKNVEDLDLLECAALASLPKSPTKLAMITTVERGAVEDDDPRLLLRGSVYDYLYNDAVLPRVKLVLDNMLDQDKITQAEYDEAMAGDLREHLHPTEIVGDAEAAFFVDWAIDNVAENLMKEYEDRFKNKDEAREFIYVKGLEIHSTFNREMQKIAADELEDPDNYPAIRNIKKDGDGNILDEDGNIVLFKRSNIIGGKGRFTFGKKEATANADGSLTIYKGRRINIYRTTVAGEPDVSIEFKDMYQQDDKGRLFIINGGVINIPQGYKTLDSEGNCVVSPAFFNDFPNFMEVGEKIVVPKSGYTLKQKVIQPQGAAVILNHDNGRVYAMVGGRGVKGEMNYNRALEPRQPGSSMKPLGAYGPAIQMSAEDEPIEDGEKSFGEYWTPLSIIVDEKFEYKGKVWPSNWYSGYRGPTTLRKSVEQSMNVNAVKVQLNVGVDRSVAFLKKLGITTLVEDGKTNDLNPAALALGGMTNGAKPIEMASAYGVFANGGVRAAPISYTEVVDRSGKVILDGTTEKKKAMDKGTAFIMNDILRTTVSNGIAGAASVSGVPVAGKTGTTSDNYDAWFVGNTPKFSMAVWIGNDVNIELSQGSAAASRLWSRIMTRVMDDREAGKYPKKPNNVIEASVSGMTDYFIKGTKPEYVSTGRTTATICEDSGYLATPWCPHTDKKSFSSVNGSASGKPRYYCNLHNTKPGKYPIDPDKKLKKDFDPDDPDGSEKKKEKKKKKKKEEETPTPEPEPTTPVSGAAFSAPVYTHVNRAYIPSHVPEVSGYRYIAGYGNSLPPSSYLLKHYFALKRGSAYG